MLSVWICRSFSRLPVPLSTRQWSRRACSGRTATSGAFARRGSVNAGRRGDYAGGVTLPEDPARSWKKTILPWVGVAMVATSNYWFRPIFRAVPMALWMLLFIVGTVWGVWRWIAFFWNRGASKP
jgi:hypothetical protein